MRYLLDTNIWIYFLKQAQSPLVARLRQTPATEIAVSAVTWAELLHGAHKYAKTDNRVTRIEATLNPFQCLTFDKGSAGHYARIRNDLEKRGEMIGPNDLMIAAVARQHGLILVSNNVKEFNRIADVKVEDWTKA